MFGRGTWDKKAHTGFWVLGSRKKAGIFATKARRILDRTNPPSPVRQAHGYGGQAGFSGSHCRGSARRAQRVFGTLVEYDAKDIPQGKRTGLRFLASPLQVSTDITDQEIGQNFHRRERQERREGISLNEIKSHQRFYTTWLRRSKNDQRRQKEQGRP